MAMVMKLSADPREPDRKGGARRVRRTGRIPGVLYGHGEPGQLPTQRLHKVEDKPLQVKWDQAEIKWYAGATLLHSAAIPAKVAKHLAANAGAVVEVKLFRAGQFLKNIGTVQDKH